MFHLARALEIMKRSGIPRKCHGNLILRAIIMLAAQTKPRVLRRGGKTVHLQFPSLKEFYSEQVPKGSFSDME